MIRRKRLFLLCCMVVAIAATFWGSARYPALGEKAAMGAGIVLEDPLSFEATFSAAPADSPARRVAITTLNWVVGNAQGMTFGILLAVSVLTLMGLLTRLSFAGRYANTLLGIGLGAPLGVCVNCAAPIAKGMHAGGARLETTLAAMISSPTLNVVILTMLFSLFPLEFALSKLFLTAATLLLVVPLVARATAAGSEAPAALAEPGAGGAPCQPDPGRVESLAPVESWSFALGWTARSFARNLGDIVRATLPPMLLAGFLGAVAITLLPWERLLALLPSGGTGLLAMLVPVAAIGLFLPVPIAFDVVLCAAFLATGMPGAYVSTLLFSLGVFSVYPFLILWRGVSRVAALGLSAALMALSVSAGVGAYYYETWAFEQQEHVLLPELAAAQPRPVAPDHTAQLSAAEVRSRVRGRASEWTLASTSADGTLLVESTLLQPGGPPTGRLQRQLGDAVGLTLENRTPAIYKFTPPYHSGWPITAGDVNDDGWPDLVVGSDHGVHLYVNDGQGAFLRQRVDLPELEDQVVGLVALVDLDADGWLDLFLSVYRKDISIVYNRRGEFSSAHSVRLTASANMLNAASFGDVDKDGDLDAVLGNWSAGRWTRDSPEASRNELLISEGRDFSRLPLEGKPGETLTALLSDFDLDGDLDLLIGNDFPDAPDFVYLGREGAAFERVTRAQQLIPHSTETTMSFDTADIDNDLVPEVYAAQISGSRPGQEALLDSWTPAEACREYEEDALREQCERRVAVQEITQEALRLRSIDPCQGIEATADRHDCMSYVAMEAAIKRVRDPEYCDRIPASREALRFICALAFAPPAEVADAERREWLPQVRNRNVLLQRAGDVYEDRAKALGVTVGGWAWNSKFADLDADGWQDLFIANGAIHKEPRESNLWFRNLEGRGFRDQTEAAGLVNHLPTGGYVYVDIDNDGDLDLVTVSIDGPLWVHRNDLSGNRSLQVELRDHAGNRFGIGGKIVVEQAGGKEAQYREIKAGGGYLSFDPYVAHFGLGRHVSVDRIVVTWSTGEVTSVPGPFAADRRYRITRGSAALGSTSVN